ncbi:hypothetical protein AD952_13590 [Acetobacter cerevisiae]|uniref:Uncharacterized protein n=1 Tax=Acetobacter cerevisiae TaxID=178900 RepID=A0A149UR15_9PROT|nr:hypothetical protein AD952_13590 [Acetobacter cerevisiae]
MPNHRITREGRGNGNTDVSGAVELRGLTSDNPIKEAQIRFSFQLKNHADMTDHQILEAVEGFLKAAKLLAEREADDH